MDKSIVVLMSTYNGEPYIREQLDSIVKQKDVSFKLLIRDDGSSDRTPEILSEYSRNYDNIDFINRDNIENKGFNRSFLSLLEEGLKREKKCKYFAFADQDDVWFENKLKSALDYINFKNDKSGTKDNALLYYYANKYWTDENLNIIAEDDFSYCRDNYFDLFMLPPVYGCTSVISRELAAKSLELAGNNKLLYDVYIFRLACLLGGTIISDRSPKMYYRRHGKNASGDAMKFSIITSVKKYIKEPNGMHGVKNYILPIYDLHKDEMPSKQKLLCELIISNERKIYCKCRLLCWKDAYKRGLKASIMWIGRVLLNAI